MSAATGAVMTADDFFMMLGALIEGRRAAFRRRCRVAFAVVDGGPFLVDTGAKQPIERRWTRDADVSVLCNRRTLSDMVAGRFDARHPDPAHLFLWGGDAEVWKTFAKAFTGGTTALGAHMAALSTGPGVTSRRKKKR